MITRVLRQEAAADSTLLVHGGAEPLLPSGRPLAQHPPSQVGWHPWGCLGPRVQVVRIGWAVCAWPELGGCVWGEPSVGGLQGVDVPWVFEDMGTGAGDAPTVLAPGWLWMQ